MPGRVQNFQPCPGNRDLCPVHHDLGEGAGLLRYGIRVDALAGPRDGASCEIGERLRGERIDAVEDGALGIVADPSPGKMEEADMVDMAVGRDRRQRLRRIPYSAEIRRKAPATIDQAVLGVALDQVERAALRQGEGVLA